MDRVRAVAATLAAAATLALGSCTSSQDAAGPGPTPGALADGSVPSVPTPVPIGRGPALRPGPGPGPPPGRCGVPRPPRGAAHLELFARGRTVIVPAGVGVGPPRTRRGPFVTGGRCADPDLRTTEPTGLIELTDGTTPTLADLFTSWGRALRDDRLLGHAGPVRAWVDGRRWRRPVGAIPLRAGAQIVLVSGPDVPVHATYAFPPPTTSHMRP